MSPVSFEDQGYTSTRTHVQKEPFSITGMLTRRGFSETTAQVALVIFAVLVIIFAIWFYYANTPHPLSKEQLQALPNPMATIPHKAPVKSSP